MNRLILLGVFMLSLSIPSYAQFIGIRIGIPSPECVGAGNLPIPANAMTFNGAVMTFNGQVMTFSGTP